MGTTITRREVMLAMAGLPLLAKDGKTAPEFVQGPWLNSKALTLAGLRGKPAIVHFWTYACGNCKANLPVYNKWFEEFGARGVEMVGVHTPELEFEYKMANIEAHVKKYGIRYPVLVDLQYKNWEKWEQRYWPTVYVLDRTAKIRGKWEGELEYRGAGGDKKMAALVREVLGEA